ncbi:condensation domain-containing protein, partial [Granulicella sp. S190]|uniref:condensation domain-containing protein n=1 Tax=Granulicella sp. S190 TaxID=1747226 RepID=UPI00131DC28F
MTFDQLLVELDKRGVELKKFNSDLFIRGSREVLDLGLKEFVRLHKSTLLDLLGRDVDQWWSTPSVITPSMLPLVTLNAEQIAAIIAQVPGGAGNVQDIYPLAPLQEGIFFHYLMADQGDPYLSSGLMAFDSRERLDGYLRAMQAVVDRHDVLRTAIFWEGLPEPVQVVLRRVILPIEEVELEGEGDAAEQLYARFDLRHSRIDLRQAPLLRLHIAYDAGQKRWLLLMLIHHLTTDHVSLELLLEEVRMHLLGRGEELPAPIPFRNYVAHAR